MYIKDLLDNNPQPYLKHQTVDSIQLIASNSDELELIQKIASVLYKHKNIRKIINVLDRISNANDLCEIRGLSSNQVVFTRDDNKPIGEYPDSRTSFTEDIMHTDEFTANYFKVKS